MPWLNFGRCGIAFSTVWVLKAASRRVAQLRASLPCPPIEATVPVAIVIRGHARGEQVGVREPCRSTLQSVKAPSFVIGLDRPPGFPSA